MYVKLLEDFPWNSIPSGNKYLVDPNKYQQKNLSFHGSFLSSVLITHLNFTILLYETNDEQLCLIFLPKYVMLILIITNTKYIMFIIIIIINTKYILLINIIINAKYVMLISIIININFIMLINIIIMLINVTTSR